MSLTKEPKAPAAETVYPDIPTTGSLLRVLLEVRNGNFHARMPVDQVGISGKICDTLNDIIAMNERMTEEFDEGQQYHQ